jgi:tetratricopeptide (TPR) repeat protein
LVAQLYERLGDVRYRVAELDRAAEAFAAALRRCAADPVAGAEVALKQALVKEKSADWEGAKTTVKRAKAALASRDDDQAVALRARCEAELATIHLFTGRMAQARKSAETAVALAAESDSDRALAQALATVEGLDLAEGRLSGPVEESAGARALAIYERLGDLRWQAALHQRLGMRAFGVGEWKRAMRHHQESVRLVMRMGDEVNVPGGLVNVAEVCIERGDLAAAEDLLHDAYRRLLAVQSPYVMAYCCTNRGRLEARLGRFDAALAAFAEARTCAEAGQLSWSEFAEIDARVAECEVFAGRGAQALEIVDALLAAEATDSVLRPQLLRYRGCGLVQIGDVAAGVSDLEASLEAAVSNGLVADEAAALDLLCRLYRDSQDSRGDALEQRREELFRRLGIVSPAPVPLVSVPEQPLDLLPATVQLPLDDQEPVL